MLIEPVGIQAADTVWKWDLEQLLDSCYTDLTQHFPHPSK